MAPGIQIVNRDKKGQIKQDYHAYKEDGKGRVVERDVLKNKEAKKSKKKK